MTELTAGRWCRVGGWLAATAIVALGGVLASGCQDAGRVSTEEAQRHTAFLAQKVTEDVEEVRVGLPQGAKHLTELYREKRASEQVGRAASAPEPASSSSGGSLAVPSTGSVVGPAPGSPPAPSSGTPAASASVTAGGGSAAPAASASAPSATPQVVQPEVEDLDPATVRSALERARNKVQDLRVSKGTFFGLAGVSGQVIRTDQDQDLMAGRSLFEPFPELKRALTAKYVETIGKMPEAAGVKGDDGQWVAAQPVLIGGRVAGLYVTGWSWSLYARRLQLALRGEVRSALPPGKNEPLVYVMIVVDQAAYGWDSPDVNQRAVLERDPLTKLQGGVYAETAELTGRTFGMAVRALPLLGPKVAVAVLRSET